MPESYGWETIEAAEELYIIDGLTFDQVAARTGVSVSQLKRWSADSDPDWPDRRREYREAQVAVRRGVMLAKARLIASVIETEDAQKAYAFGALVSSGKQIDAEARERAQAAPSRTEDAPALAAEMTDPIGALREAIKQRVAGLLQTPGGITLAAIKELVVAMELLEKKVENTAENVVREVKKTGLSSDTVEDIRRQILGIGQ